MPSETLTKDNEVKIKNVLQDFVLRVASDTDNKWPEEVAALPAVTQLLIEYFTN